MRQARIVEEHVYKLRRTQIRWKRGREARALHELQREGLLIIFQLLLPVALTDNHTVANFLGVGQKLTESNRYRCARDVAESGFVNSIDEITGVSEFDREKERRRSVDSFQLDALGVCPARSDPVPPEAEAARVSLPVQKIQILLANEK